jgi:hypothetical protein
MFVNYQLISCTDDITTQDLTCPISKQVSDVSLIHAYYVYFWIVLIDSNNWYIKFISYNMVFMFKYFKADIFKLQRKYLLYLSKIYQGTGSMG